MKQEIYAVINTEENCIMSDVHNDQLLVYEDKKVAEVICEGMNYVQNIYEVRKVTLGEEG